MQGASRRTYSVQERAGAKPLLEILRHRYARLRHIWADGAYAGPLVEWVKGLRPPGPFAWRLPSVPTPSRGLWSFPSAGLSKVANYKTPIQTTTVYPMIGLTGVLHLVTVVDKFRPQAVEEKGSVCQPPSSPPVHRSQRAHPAVDTAACDESPTPPVAAQSATGAPAARRRRAGGGPR